MISLNEAAGAASLYQIKITLAWSKPPIWRRVIVRSDMTLDRLHDVIQWVMPWTDSHLHQFVVGKTYYALPNPEFENDSLDEQEYGIADIAPNARNKFQYEYDFGDGWRHDLLVEKVLPPDPAFKHPVCVAGANACPPEDCGGIPGYYDMLEALANPKHPRHSECMEWMGEEWDAKQFDLDEINAALKHLNA